MWVRLATITLADMRAACIVLDLQACVPPDSRLRQPLKNEMQREKNMNEAGSHEDISPHACGAPS